MRRPSPSWATRIPAPPRKQFDKKTQKSILRSIKRALAGRWDGKSTKVPAP